MKESIGMHRSQNLNICIQRNSDVSPKNRSFITTIENFLQQEILLDKNNIKPELISIKLVSTQFYFI